MRIWNSSAIVIIIIIAFFYIRFMTFVTHKRRYVCMDNGYNMCVKWVGGFVFVNTLRHRAFHRSLYFDVQRIPAPLIFLLLLLSLIHSHRLWFKAEILLLAICACVYVRMCVCLCAAWLEIENWKLPRDTMQLLNFILLPPFRWTCTYVHKSIIYIYMYICVCAIHRSDQAANSANALIHF